MTSRTILILITITILSCGQVDRDLIRLQTELEFRAMMNDDFETMVKFIHPNIVNLYGGRERTLELLKGTKDFTRKQGLIYDSISVGLPSNVVREKDELQCLIPTTVFLRGPKGKFKWEMYSIGVSKDDGKNWFLIKMSNMTREKIKVSFPNLSDDIIIPAEKLPEKIGD